MLVKTYGSAVFGIDATTITIEVNIANGVNFSLVGLPDNAVRESHQRIKAALKNNGFNYPGKEITINMAPADIRKEGSTFDLAIAVGILAASEQIQLHLLDDYLLLGELSLDGSLQPVKGILPIAMQAKKEGFKGIILPETNAEEAAIVGELNVYGVHTLTEACSASGKIVYLKPSRFSSKLGSLALASRAITTQGLASRALITALIKVVLPEPDGATMNMFLLGSLPIGIVTGRWVRARNPNGSTVPSCSVHVALGLRLPRRPCLLKFGGHRYERS